MVVLLMIGSNCLTVNYTDTKTFPIRKQLSIIRGNFPQMESSGFPLLKPFDWWLIHKEAKKRAMILAQNELQPQEEFDENGNRGILPITRRTYFACPCQSIMSTSLSFLRNGEIEQFGRRRAHSF